MHEMSYYMRIDADGPKMRNGLNNHLDYSKTNSKGYNFSTIKKMNFGRFYSSEGGQFRVHTFRPIDGQEYCSSCIVKVKLPLDDEFFKMTFEYSRGCTNMVIIDLKKTFSLDLPKEKEYHQMDDYLKKGDLCTFAASKGDIKGLEWCKENVLEFNSSACMSAAYFGKFDTLKWLRENQCPWDYRTPMHVITSPFLSTIKKLEMLKWCKENNCDFGLGVSSSAAGEDLEIFQWLIQNECPMDEYTTSNAVQENNLEMLKIAIAKGCKPRNDLCDIAVMNDNMEMLQWIIGNGLGWGDQDQVYFRVLHPIGKINFPMFRWIVKNGCKSWTYRIEEWMADEPDETKILSKIPHHKKI